MALRKPHRDGLQRTRRMTWAAISVTAIAASLRQQTTDIPQNQFRIRRRANIRHAHFTLAIDHRRQRRMIHQTPRLAFYANAKVFPDFLQRRLIAGKKRPIGKISAVAFPVTEQEPSASRFRDRW